MQQGEGFPTQHKIRIVCDTQMGDHRWQSIQKAWFGMVNIVSPPGDGFAIRDRWKSVSRSKRSFLGQLRMRCASSIATPRRIRPSGATLSDRRRCDIPAKTPGTDIGYSQTCKYTSIHPSHHSGLCSRYATKAPANSLGGI